MQDARTIRCFRRWTTGEDPEQLLEPGNQWSTPWGAPDHGPCDKCDGSGTTRYRCRGCLVGGADPDCPACAGRVAFEAVCPACEGDGEIDRTTRDGVSVFPTLDGLYRYIAERDGDGDFGEQDAVVELAARLSDELDLDADAGALLVKPDRVLSLRPFSRRRAELLRDAAAQQPDGG